MNREELIKSDINKVIQLLQTDVNKGLSDKEVEERLKQYGYNAVEEEKRNPLKELGKKFWNVTAWVLEIAAILSFILGRYLDFYIIVALIVVNAFISFSEEQRANRALELLRQKLQIQARVLRNGEWKLVPAKFLVPGDIVRIRAGDFVPADVKIIKGEVEVDQSALTGESLTVFRRDNDVVYSGSIIRRGEATGVVILTGQNTYFGKTVELVKIAKPRLRIEKVVSRIVFWMMMIVIVLLVISGIVLVIKGENIFEFLPLALVLIVAAIPIALPAMFSVSLALGSQELSKAGVLVTRLDAIEGASTMNVLCSDKTGTITMNKLSVHRIIPINGNDKEVILYGALASTEANQDPIDLAFINKAKEMNLDLSSWSVKEFIPFDPSTRRTESLVTKDGKSLRLTKGAIDVISKLCGLENIQEIYMKAEEEAKIGCRVLAVAKKEEGEKWKLVGLVSLRDPPRPDSAELVKELHDLGIKVIMLTGDSEPIAKQIAKEVGIGENVVKVSDIKEKPEIVEKVDGLAEVYPEDKYTVVKVLQKNGYVVGMTGDGVNDAPALRAADVGIAVSNATDVAKAAAAVVLTTPGLRNIVDMVKIGRQIYERVRIWVLSRITRTFQNVIFVALAFILLAKFIISTFGMVLLLFMFDFVTLTMSTDNVSWPKKPAVWNINQLVVVSAILGSVMIIESFVTLYFIVGLSLNVMQTLVFAYLLYSNIFNLLNIRETDNFWKRMPSKIMLISMIVDIIISFVIITFGIPGLTPAPIKYTLIVFILALVFNLIINNFIKIWVKKITKIEW
ncbi:plasma-membrane proton-efflux P-type ATPase [Sulfurisphaera ohwakuensis]|uniref:H+-transporting ATPase n=1 Tax=Sulfurisphaera ohwakuensis TaxID=69656 RepID=A0A650CFL9_SULOH|nr:plasma-membrane proton-efflux P-type ATPase [Sulfurisphaera ohwakuensis]MBB5254904.1 H+-transporting ATPase [Sulfurisphaera ohwakuensis]QGR16582.1 plasma-membrane proton-efflux P-type ATPase [Sulfurisphaera ohwakuensis]